MHSPRHFVPPPSVRGALLAPSKRELSAEQTEGVNTGKTGIFVHTKKRPRKLSGAVLSFIRS